MSDLRDLFDRTLGKPKDGAAPNLNVSAMALQELLAAAAEAFVHLQQDHALPMELEASESNDIIESAEAPDHNQVTVQG